MQSGVANAINTRSKWLTARTLGAGGLHSSHGGEAFFPGLIEEQSEAFRDGVPIGRDFDGGKGAAGHGQAVLGISDRESLVQYFSS